MSSGPNFHPLGFEARACYGGVAALELIQTFRPSICFIDLNMPGMNGDELAHQLRATPGWRPLLLVAVTAMTDSESRAHIQDAGFDLHFIKPVDPEKLRLM